MRSPAPQPRKRGCFRVPQNGARTRTQFKVVWEPNYSAKVWEDEWFHCVVLAVVGVTLSETSQELREPLLPPMNVHVRHAECLSICKVGFSLSKNPTRDPDMSGTPLQRPSQPPWLIRTPFRVATPSLPHPHGPPSPPRPESTSSKLQTTSVAPPQTNQKPEWPLANGVAAMQLPSQ
jgi:hypothetical protein